MDQGIAARDLPVVCFPILDVYGQCQQVTIVSDNGEANNPTAQLQDYQEKANKEDGEPDTRLIIIKHRQPYIYVICFNKILKVFYP